MCFCTSSSSAPRYADAQDLFLRGRFAKPKCDVVEDVEIDFTWFWLNAEQLQIAMHTSPAVHCAEVWIHLHVGHALQ